MKTYLQTSNHFNHIPRQDGAVLIVALVLLIVLTMLGISAMESTKLETRMAANTTEYYRAFQTSEAGLDGALEFYMQSPANVNTIKQSEYQEIGSLNYKEGEKISSVRLEAKLSNRPREGSGFRQFYLVRSTGYSQAQENEDGKVVVGDESLTTRVEAGVSTIVPADKNLGTAIPN